MLLNAFPNLVLSPSILAFYGGHQWSYATSRGRRNAAVNNHGALTQEGSGHQ